MKCKRCGEPLDPMDTHCPVCGRAAAPRKKAPSQKKSESSVVKLPQLDKFTHAYAQNAARSRLLQLVTIAAVAAAIVLAVLVYMGIGELQDSVNQLRLTADAQAQQSQNQTEPTNEAETEPTGSTEPQTQAPTEPEALPLSRQDLVAALSLYRTDNGTYAATSMEPAAATAWVNTVREGSARWNNVTWILEDTGDRLTLKLHDSYGGEEAQAVLTLDWTLEGDTFAAYAGAVCIWECRVAGGEWESLPNDRITTDPAAGTSRLALTADLLTTLMGQHSVMELRCHVSLTHPDGGNLRIVTDGITIDTEGPVSGGTMLD